MGNHNYLYVPDFATEEGILVVLRLRKAPMLTSLLVFRAGYMPAYDGAGTISGAESHIEEHGEGGEMLNFRIEGGRCHGYPLKMAKIAFIVQSIALKSAFAALSVRYISLTVRSIVPKIADMTV